MKLKRKILVGTAITLTVAGGAGAAFAYFTSGQATGSGKATVSDKAPTLEITVPDVAGLAPGAGAQSVQYRIKNLGTSDTQINDVKYTIDQNGSTCTKANFSLNGAAPGSDVVIPALNQLLTPGQFVDWSLTIELVESGGNQDACKGAINKIVITANN